MSPHCTLFDQLWLFICFVSRQILHSTGLEFQHQVQEAKDLDQLIKIHYRYLATIHDRCLLREKVNFYDGAVTTSLTADAISCKEGSCLFEMMKKRSFVYEHDEQLEVFLSFPALVQKMLLHHQQRCLY